MSDERQALRDASARLAKAGVDNPRLDARVLWEATLNFVQADRNSPFLPCGAPHDAPHSAKIAGEVAPPGDGGGTEELANPAPLDACQSSAPPSVRFAATSPAISPSSGDHDGAPQGRKDQQRLALFQSFITRRAAREPVAYITGHREFWSLDFAVAPGVLIPRPDTETLIEAVLADFPDHYAALRVLDLGTGSGCILAALLSEYPRAEGIGVDSSAVAQAIAGKNLERLGLAKRGVIRAGDWAEGLEPDFDVVVSNPPYIKTTDVAGLEPDVRDFEPFAALDGGPDGLEALRALAPALKRFGAPAYIEIGAGQGAEAAAVFTDAGLDVVRIAPDLAGIPRIVITAAKKELE